MLFSESARSLDIVLIATESLPLESGKLILSLVFYHQGNIVSCEKHVLSEVLVFLGHP